MDESFYPSLISGTFIGGAAGYLGSLMLSRKMALVAGPLGHLALPGVALALLWGFDVSLGAFPFVILGVVLIWMLERKTKLPMEALTAIVFATGVAIAFLLLPVEQAETALVGDILQARPRDTAIAGVAAVAVVFAGHRAYPNLVLSDISEDLAASEGISVKRNTLLYLLLIAVVVGLGVRMVGGLLTAALVAIPPAAARNVAANLRQYTLGSTAAGMASAILGVLLSWKTELPAGPLVILVSTAGFLLTLPFTTATR